MCSLQGELAEKQLKYEMDRLNADRLIDVSSGADVRPDVLKDLYKLTVPTVRKGCDRLREAMKVYSRERRADRELVMGAQEACENAQDWICDVEERCRVEQLHIEAKQLTKEVDFEPFKSG
jgi:hypothetical protein